MIRKIVLVTSLYIIGFIMCAVAVVVGGINCYCNEGYNVSTGIKVVSQIPYVLLLFVGLVIIGISRHINRKI
jgi:uncharacterized membrane protein